MQCYLYPGYSPTATLNGISDGVISAWAKAILLDRLPYCAPPIYSVLREKRTDNGTEVFFKKELFSEVAIRAIISAIPEVASTERARTIIVAAVEYRLAHTPLEKIEEDNVSCTVMLDLIEALGNLGGKESLGVLQRIASSVNTLSILRSSAREAIQEIGK